MEKQELKGFYLGIYLPELNQGIKPVQLRTIERSLQTRFRILSLYQAWGPESLEQFPETLLQEVYQQGAVPLIARASAAMTGPARAWPK